MRLITALALLALSGSLHAQVYRCGNTYSSAPCAGGRSVDTSPAISAQGGAAGTTTLYLCQSYGGGQFWALEHCSQRSALVERMESVPAGMPFDQQVELAQGQRAKSAALAAPPVQTTRIESHTPSKASQCTELEGRIRYLDSWARAGGNASTMDWIANERKQSRDQQFRIRC
ncbi:hypothetical protein [Rhodoferax sp. WC2427]|uniref:hypothetical protein n=1 Tax=Rhodoferax sp. WC2427 TaxID=3234144 RepID=UPI003467265B